MVLARGLEEAGRLAKAMGANPFTFSGLAGVGDLVAAQAVPGHPSYDAGMALSKGNRAQGPAAITRALVRLAQNNKVELPLTEALQSVYDGAEPVDAVQRLMGRAPSAERR